MNKPIPEDKRAMARAMVEAGYPYNKISETLGISTGSIVSIIRAAYDENMGGLIDEARKELSGNFALMANTLMKRINYQTVHDASLKDMAIAVGDTDINRLTAGKFLGGSPQTQ